MNKELSERSKRLDLLFIIHPRLNNTSLEDTEKAIEEAFGNLTLTDEGVEDRDDEEYDYLMYRSYDIFIGKSKFNFKLYCVDFDDVVVDYIIY